ncbi:MAG: hypothetical protein ACFFCQ_13645 [Promethearchaeota archaeon]
MVKLIYKEKEFVDAKTEGDAYLEIDDVNKKATLSFGPGASLITKRTATRQARGICKTGFLLTNGQRVGELCELEIESEGTLDERLLQEGHKYR